MEHKKLQKQVKITNSATELKYLYYCCIHTRLFNIYVYIYYFYYLIQCHIYNNNMILLPYFKYYSLTRYLVVINCSLYISVQFSRLNRV